MEDQKAEKHKTAMPIIAGILMLVSAGYKLIAISGLLIAGIFIALPGNFPNTGALLGVFLLVPALAIIALELAGGVFSLRRKKWGWALAGAIVAIPPFFLIGTAATILVGVSRNEFD
jgi:hypothetical protein